VDDYVSLSQRLLSRCPAAGIALSQQLINDSWHQLQARRQWSWRRRSGIFAPPNLYAPAAPVTASSNVSAGSPTLITGIGTAWTPQMVGQQIRIGGLLNPYYTIVQWLSPTAILIDQPWAGADVVNQTFQVLQIYFPVPADFGYFYVAVSIKDAYRLWTGTTQYELAMLDPQRTNQGQTYAIAFKDYTPIYGGVIGPVTSIAATGAAPVSATTTGYSFIADATYIIQVIFGGTSGSATYQWMRAGQSQFTGPLQTSDQLQDLMDGVQVYWPDTVVYNAGDLFTINARAQIATGVPRYELWPGPTFTGYLYPYIYYAKEYDLSAAQPQLPPFIAGRGEVILEMALAKCATYPGADADHPNPYFNLALAKMHETKVEMMMVDLERNDEEIGVSNLEYEDWPYMGPWMDGSWRQRHAPFMRG